MTRARSTGRSGFSLIELLIILVLSAIVMTGLTSVLVRQQRFYRGTADIIETRSQIRQAAGIIPSDLRGISSIGGDIIAISDTSIVFWATIGQAVACVNLPGAYSIAVPPLALANKNTLTSFTMIPEAGDKVWVYQDGASVAAANDYWKAYTITDKPTLVTTPCVTLTGAADQNTQRYRFPLEQPLDADITVGNPVRFVRQTTYTLFEAANETWYLGYCSPVCAGAPQPIAGPFLPGGGGAAGVSFSYQDAAGAVTAIPANVAQVSIVVRGRTHGRVDMGGSRKSDFVGDSLRFSVAIRNRQ